MFFLSENVQFLEVKISIYLNRRVFVMDDHKVPLSGLHYSLRKHAYSKLLINFTTKKKASVQIKNSDIFHISAQNIDCGYSLEPPRRGGSNEYPQSMFLS